MVTVVGKRRRKLRPRERAYQNQKRAAILGSSDPRTAVVSVVILSSGMYQCCWCDCPAPDLDESSPHRQPGYVCDNGCPDEAQFIIIQFHGAPLEQRLPACARHSDDVVAMFHRVVTTVEHFCGPASDARVRQRHISRYSATTNVAALEEPSELLRSAVTGSVPKPLERPQRSLGIHEALPLHAVLLGKCRDLRYATSQSMQRLVARAVSPMVRAFPSKAITPGSAQNVVR
jgi:hypothetical protein